VPELEVKGKSRKPEPEQRSREKEVVGRKGRSPTWDARRKDGEIKGVAR